jgi:hypothetical protein
VYDRPFAPCGLRRPDSLRKTAHADLLAASAAADELAADAEAQVFVHDSLPVQG